MRGREHKVVLIDMKLADEDGSAVFRLVQEMTPTARTILITGYRGEVDRLVEQVLGEGADAVSYKPFDIDKLLATLKELVGGK